MWLYNSLHHLILTYSKIRNEPTNSYILTAKPCITNKKHPALDFLQRYKLPTPYNNREVAKLSINYEMRAVLAKARRLVSEVRRDDAGRRGDFRVPAYCSPVQPGQPVTHHQNPAGRPPLSPTQRTIKISVNYIPAKGETHKKVPMVHF